MFKRSELLDWFKSKCDECKTHDVSIGEILDKIAILWKDNPKMQVKICNEFFEIYGVRTDGPFFEKYDSKKHSPQERVNSNFTLSLIGDRNDNMLYRIYKDMRYTSFAAS